MILSFYDSKLPLINTWRSDSFVGNEEKKEEKISLKSNQILVGTQNIYDNEYFNLLLSKKLHIFCFYVVLFVLIHVDTLLNTCLDEKCKVIKLL